MADPAIVERLAAVRVLRDIPRRELEWLADHGTIETYRAGTVLAPEDTPIDMMSFILAGAISIHVDRGGIRRRVMEWRAGDLTGALPYSRMVKPPGDTLVHEDTELFRIDREHFRELTRECPEVTALCVHTMLDRARLFTSANLQDEKMVSLGKLSAGLAHELNNPASAVSRSAERLAEQMREAEGAARALAGVGLDAAQQALLDEVRAMSQVVPPAFLDTPLERADRVDAIAEWLDQHSVDVDAAAVAETAVSIDALDRLAAAMPPLVLEDAVRWLAACHVVRAAASDIQAAMKRISDLIASVKGFTYMGRAAVAEPVNLARGLQDTVRILASKARDKAVTVALEVPADLPLARAFGSELNQIWSNLIDNALDAVSYGGHVTVRAECEAQWIVVRVIDDGHGIPDDIISRIFDPFFTTKPVGEGTGMGLDLVRRLVFHQSGEVDVQSRPGRTEFRVAIPVAAPVAARPAG